MSPLLVSRTLCLALLGAPLLAAAAGGGGGGAGGSSVPTCVEVRGEARYGGYGFDHIVHLKNGCDRTAACEVATDVNPTAAKVTVPAGRRAEVVTFRGSPAREFAVRATCSLVP